MKRFTLTAFAVCLLAGCVHVEEDAPASIDAEENRMPTPEAGALDRAQEAEAQALLREAETMAAMRETLAYSRYGALGGQVSINAEQDLRRQAQWIPFFSVSADDMRKNARERTAKALDAEKRVPEMREKATQIRKEEEFVKAFHYEEYAEALEKEAEASRRAAEAWEAAAQAQEASHLD